MIVSDVFSAPPVKLPDTWLDALCLSERLGKDVFLQEEASQATSVALKSALASGITAIHCINNLPVTAILYQDKIDAGQVNCVHKILWNQGIADVLLVLSQDTILLYSLWSVPGVGDEKRLLDADWLLKSLSLSEEYDNIQDIIPSIESGNIFSAYPEHFDPSTRVDSQLVRDLIGYRQLLQKNNQVNVGAAHSILLQAMFLLYLWDRKIIDSEFIFRHTGSHYSSLDELLSSSIEDWTALLEHLNKALNGKILSPRDTIWASSHIVLADFLRGKLNPKTNELRLLRIYQFNNIPVELFSEVYDRFLEDEGSKKGLGAYFTPRRLAELVVDQVWPFIFDILKQKSIPKILDPACGSGIFLVLLFQRIVEYRKYVNGNLSWDELKQIAFSLHGADKNPTAVRIAAFSIALALLNERTPKDLQSLIDTGEQPLLPPIIGDTLKSVSFFNLPEDSSFDVVIGNPPWGQYKHPSQPELQRDAWESFGHNWCSQNGREIPYSERSWPFVWKSIKHLKTSGCLALLLPTTGFFFNASAHTSLIKLFLKDIQLSRLIDLSDLRNILFDNGKIPACIILAILSKDVQQAYTYEHLSPKADLHATQSKRILLAKEDYHRLSVSEMLVSPPMIFKRLMWGNPVEQKLLNYLESMPKLGELLLPTQRARSQKGKEVRPEWGVGLGFQSIKENSNEKPLKLNCLNELPYIQVEDLKPFAQKKVHPSYYGTDTVRRVHFWESYYAPHIVLVPSVRKSQEELPTFRATYSDISFCFNMSMLGICVPNTQEGKSTAKILTAFLNSELASWYLSCTTKIGSDRNRLSKRNDFFSLPFPQPSDFRDQQRAKEATTAILNLYDSLDSEKSIVNDLLLSPIEPRSGSFFQDKFNAYIYNYFGLKEHEVKIIRESLEFVRLAAYPGKSDRPALWEPTSTERLSMYCATLSQSLTDSLKYNYKATAKVVSYTREFGLIKISLREKNRDINDIINSSNEENMTPLYKVNAFQKMISKNIYLLRKFFFFIGDDIFMIKPIQLRFWLTESAYRDAEELLDYILAENIDDSSHTDGAIS
ncbi:MAG: SAM-dependent methyltransferase [Deltaproteobacteria bacterium]|jgi:type I restriction-modification system DNA methylase subunit|nr:SAM-dependent methyltransferase [Deltaproteobacteria bacterium]